MKLFQLINKLFINDKDKMITLTKVKIYKERYNF